MACEYCTEYTAYPIIKSFTDSRKGAFCHHCNTIYDLEVTKPLTLEQLRERNGKSVYCMGIVNAGLTDWGIVNAAKRKVYDGGGDFWDFDEHGNAWLAYDRKPQIANETKGG